MIYLFLATAYLSITFPFRLKIFVSRPKVLVNALKYDPETLVKISVKKPLGLVLEEIVPGKPKGVYVAECGDGSAKATGKVYAGLCLIKASGIDMRNLDFDNALDVLISLPANDPIELVFADPRLVAKGPAILNVTTITGQKVVIKCLKGQVMRDVLMNTGIEIYDMKGKLTNCGGGGSCGTCVVDVIAEDWEPRADYEAKRLKKYKESCRLSCSTIIEGDADIIVKPNKIVD